MCVLVCAPSSVSIVRAVLTASEQFKKVDSALSLVSELTLESQGDGEKWQVTLHCPFLGVKLKWLPDLLC